MGERGREEGCSWTAKGSSPMTKLFSSVSKWFGRGKPSQEPSAHGPEMSSPPTSRAADTGSNTALVADPDAVCPTAMSGGVVPVPSSCGAQAGALPGDDTEEQKKSRKRDCTKSKSGDNKKLPELRVLTSAGDEIKLNRAAKDRMNKMRKKHRANNPDKIEMRVCSVKLELLNARHLPKMDTIGRCDGFCQLNWLGKEVTAFQRKRACAQVCIASTYIKYAHPNTGRNRSETP